MRISAGLDEDGVVVGNVFDKYQSKNPIVRRIMRGFDQSLGQLVQRAEPATISEIGCGEGYWTLSWIEQGLEARGTDFSAQVIELARLNAEARGISPGVFEVRSIYDVRPHSDGADLVVCCEVLEHLEDPELALAALQKIVRKSLIVSVPREPIWRAMNMLRGKYLGDLGNTPGHIQHWSKGGLLRLVERYFEVIDIRTPLPWTMVLCRSRS
jgi:2-polyprenyl-3-methyl-5-hydroxy-6-metoxy-1,4-benzoquinol methylase